MVSQKLIKFLETGKIKYETLKHRTVYTAHDKAATLRVPQKIIGKTLAVKLDRDFSLILIPANKNLDKERLKKTANVLRKKSGQRPVKNINFATEAWIKKNLKGVKVGAIPSLGGLWGLSTFVDRSLINQSKIIINGGDYNHSIKINPASLKKLTPDLLIGSFSKPRK